MITPSFSLTATERVLPKLALDFTTASLDPRVTFTRTGNTATVVNSSGLIAPINADLPRFDFNPITLVCRGLLIEEARTNLFTYSDQLNDATWTKQNLSISADAINSPDGTTNADLLVENSATASRFVFSSVTMTVGVVYTASVFAKAKERVQIFINESGANQAVYDVQAGTVVSASGCTATITAFPNGWFRCTWSKTAAFTVLRIGMCVNGGTYTGDGTSGLYMWGAQLEVGAFQTSYIPTTTTSLTRNADVATMTGTNFSDWYNATEGTFVATTNKTTTAVTANYLSANDGSNTNRMQLVWNSTTNSHSSEIIATTSQASLTTGAIATGTNKASLGYKLDNIAASVNGATPLTDTSATIPTVNTLSIGGRTYLSNNFLNGWFVKLFYYPQRLTNNEVQAFSK